MTRITVATAISSSPSWEGTGFLLSTKLQVSYVRTKYQHLKTVNGLFLDKIHEIQHRVETARATKGKTLDRSWLNGFHSITEAKFDCAS